MPIPSQYGPAEWGINIVVLCFGVGALPMCSAAILRNQVGFTLPSHAHAVHAPRRSKLRRTNRWRLFRTIAGARGGSDRLIQFSRFTLHYTVVLARHSRGWYVSVVVVRLLCDPSSAPNTSYSTYFYFSFYVLWGWDGVVVSTCCVSINCILGPLLVVFSAHHKDRNVGCESYRALEETKETII